MRKRGQYKSVDFMKALARNAPADATRILGVTEGDLAIPTLTFVFGQAQLDGQVAVVSLARLRQEFYGLPADDATLHERWSRKCSTNLATPLDSPIAPTPNAS